MASAEAPSDPGQIIDTTRADPNLGSSLDSSIDAGPCIDAAGRRERRKAETRARLLDAARRLFARRGYDAVRPQDIAREADVAVGTFYTYFADKPDVYTAFVREVGDELLAALTGAWRADDDFEMGLTHVLEALLDHSDSHPGVLGVAFGESAIGARASERALAGFDPESGAPVESLRDRLAARLADAIALGADRGHLQADYDPTFIAQAMVALIHQGLVHAGDQPRARVIAQLTRFCRRALVMPTTTATSSPQQETSP